MIKKIINLLFLCIAASHAVQVQKIFHHKIQMDDQPKLELAKIVLYLDAQAILKQLDAKQNRSNAMESLLFFIPEGKLSPELKGKLSQASSLKNFFYRMDLQETTIPAKGVLITFNYDPRRILVTNLFFDAVTRAKGIEFRLFNKQLLETLKNKSQTPVLRTTWKEPFCVIIDCGHGGTDFGTTGFGALEKNITLAVGQQLAQYLKSQNIKTILTRSDDRFVPLDERTQLANKNQGTILISLHANNASKPSTHGLETFYVNSDLFTTGNFSLRTSIDIINEYDQIQAKASKALAASVHKTLLDHLKSLGYTVTDRAVKSTVAQVLRGADMPAVLIELDFLSHAPTAQLLASHHYQTILAHGIGKGIQTFKNDQKVS